MSVSLLCGINTKIYKHKNLASRTRLSSTVRKQRKYANFWKTSDVSEAVCSQKLWKPKKMSPTGRRGDLREKN